MQNPLSVLSRLMLLALLSISVVAQAAYVTDDLSVNLRTGPGTQYRITKLMPAGTRIDVQDTQQGWAKVSTPFGEGWMLADQISDTPSAKARLASAERTVTQLKEENQSLESSLTETRTTRDELKKSLSDLQARYDDLQTEHKKLRESTGNLPQIVDENKTLKQRLSKLETQTEDLSTQNVVLRTNIIRDCLIVGAGILIAGMLLGLLLPMLKRRKKTDWA